MSEVSPGTPAATQQAAEQSERPQRLVIVGFGMVGSKLVERLTALDVLERFHITLVGEEPYRAYDRIHLTEWLDHGDFECLALGRPGWNQTPAIRTLTGDRATSIDRGNRTVHTDGGGKIPYDRLVLATGASAFRPPIQGAKLDGVFVYRTLDDLKQIGVRSRTVESAVVVGGGLLGIETAEALHRRGLDVTLLESGPCLMKRQLDPETASHVERTLADTGIATVTDARVQRIERRGRRLALTFSDSEESLVAGLIVFAAGVRPRDELARQAGLAVDPQGGGIVVDNQLRTTDPAIHAIGDCASHGGVSYGLVAPGYRMSETLAEILAGRRKRFDGYAPAVRLRLGGIDVWALGKPDERGVRVNWGGEGVYRRVTVRATRIRAAVAIGPWHEIGYAQDMIRLQRRAGPQILHRFIHTGSFSGIAKALPVTEWPASSIVCNCLEVTRGVLGTAREEGCSSVEALADRTGASTICGSCRPLLSELVGDAASGARTVRWGELGVAAAAAALALVIAGGDPIPPATSVRTGNILDTLYRESWWRQVTGYGVLGSVAVGAATYSLRKRWRRLKWGSIGRWRVTHAAIGVLALVALAAHTGLRLGSGFNSLLMAAFLATTLLGGAAAAGIGRKHARATYRFHVLAAWPLPALLIFHILSSYYF
ncbi:MAG: FAD-dependent oxidoreductase [Gammaproteobacteria bacterium]|nr:FAD-dependent oxidoreductase [Rhodospirillaceae bacterium]MDE0061835.1 FAD-dependent oxidoreductase [Gammaproteobacteria bacterium]MDE0363055.1 FAD-dependent oxidoreductase [Rhodospirillaceae bacterium]